MDQANKMLYGSWNELIDSELQKKLIEIAKFIQKLSDFEVGSRVVNDKIKANFLSYDTVPDVEREWEAHRKHIDLHYIIKGNEQIDLAASTNLSPQPYHEVDDFYLLRGKKEMSVLLSVGQFLLLEPDKAHKTGISIDKSERIQKIVFKIKV
ncbi:YhcH/YjgK/YiaL family protein [Enterococcus gallinarum]|uniref:YhcH/YjgK/YiaL family protein n=1 Tax=Enterococcus gallinarum TaxID=1353 RepID=UPI001AD61FDC|nr:YhcH/YjgK/YiaL family protein [Enterococcus gallinarum]MBO6423009.1 DUF386 domain-containing protein [Enterococcus gallinarum]